MIPPGLKVAIDKLESDADCKEAWALVKVRWDTIERHAVLNFSIGDPVEWDSKKGCVKRGIVKRINQKSVTVDVKAKDGGDLFNKHDQTWKVAPSFLRPWKDKE